MMGFLGGKEVPKLAGASSNIYIPWKSILTIYLKGFSEKTIILVGIYFINNSKGLLF